MLRRRPAACRSLPALGHRPPSTVRDSGLQKSTSARTPPAVNCTRQLPAEVYQRSDTAPRQLYETAACRSLPALGHRPTSTVRDSCLQKSSEGVSTASSYKGEHEDDVDDEEEEQYDEAEGVIVIVLIIVIMITLIIIIIIIIITKIA